MRGLALLAGLVLASCAPAPASEERSSGPTIVSLNPCSDAVLAEVTAPGQLLAISHYSHDPASSSMERATARRFRAVSGSIEEVLVLAPDIVVADQFLPPATRDALDRLGMRLVQMPIVTSTAEAKAQVAQLAALAGQPRKGAALNARIDAALAAAAPDANSPRPSALVWQSGGIVPGGDTLIADLLTRTGLRHFSSGRGMRQADYLPLETLLADPPDVILTAGNAHANEDRALSHPALASLTGTRRERFDRSLLWCGGPTIIRAANRLRHVRDSL